MDAWKDVPELFLKIGFNTITYTTILQYNRFNSK